MSEPRCASSRGSGTRVFWMDAKSASFATTPVSCRTYVAEKVPNSH
jgi:hypothetical protein